MTDVMTREPLSWQAHAHIDAFRATDEREAAFTLFPRQARWLEKLGVIRKGPHGGLEIVRGDESFTGRGLAIPHITGAMLAQLGAIPVDQRDEIGNLLVNAGINRMGSLLIAGGGQGYDATHTAIGAGDTNTAAAATQTDLAAAVNAANRYVQVADSAPTFATQVLTVVATFATGNGNFAWAEWAVGQNTASGANAITAPMLNRKVASLGTKTSSAAWQFTCTITLS